MSLFLLFFFNDTATTEIYTLSLHDALPICPGERQHENQKDDGKAAPRAPAVDPHFLNHADGGREHHGKQRAHIDEHQHVAHGIGDPERDGYAEEEQDVPTMIFHAYREFNLGIGLWMRKKSGHRFIGVVGSSGHLIPAERRIPYLHKRALLKKTNAENICGFASRFLLR